MTTDSTEVDHGSLLGRRRSAMLLAVMVVVLGLLSAAVLGVLVVAVATLLDHALG